MINNLQLTHITNDQGRWVDSSLEAKEGSRSANVALVTKVVCQKQLVVRTVLNQTLVVGVPICLDDKLTYSRLNFVIICGSSKVR